MAGDITTTTVNRHGKFFRLIDGTIVQFTAMLDGNCRPTNDADAAIVAIYKLSDGRYRGVDIRLFRDEDGNDAAAYPGCDDLECTAVNLRGRFFRLADDTILKFSATLDVDCNVTNDPCAAIVAIVQLPDGMFRGLDLRIFDDHPDMQETLQ